MRTPTSKAAWRNAFNIDLYASARSRYLPTNATRTGAWSLLLANSSLHVCWQDHVFHTIDLGHCRDLIWKQKNNLKWTTKSQKTHTLYTHRPARRDNARQVSNCGSANGGDNFNRCSINYTDIDIMRNVIIKSKQLHWKDSDLQAITAQRTDWRRRARQWCVLRSLVWTAPVWQPPTCGAATTSDTWQNRASDLHIHTHTHEYYDERGQMHSRHSPRERNWLTVVCVGLVFCSWPGASGIRLTCKSTNESRPTLYENYTRTNTQIDQWQYQSTSLAISLSLDAMLR